MNTLKSHKINLLLKAHVPGTVVTSQLLAANGISNDLVRVYVSSGWLDRIGRGAYIRSGDKVDWQGALYSLQTQTKLPIQVGGLDALRLKGLGHYLPFSEETVKLFSNGRENVPEWFRNYDWGVSIEFHTARLFNLSPEQLSLSNHAHKSFEIKVSSPEQAMLEMLSLAKNNEDFDAAKTVFDGLTALRPKEAQRLLEACRSIRVKRMFLWMTRECDHPWAKHLDTSVMNLGSGKRVIYKKGQLDRELQITVPRQNGEQSV